MIDRYIGPVGNQIVGVATGIIFCAWFTGATPEQVAVIRLPATLLLAAYVWTSIGFWIYGLAKRIA